MRRSISLRMITTHPTMIALVVGTLAGGVTLLMAFVVGLVGASTASAASTTYTVKDLGTLGGTITFPNMDRTLAKDVNDSGQIVGHSNTSSGARHAFLYSGGQMKDLGTLPGGNQSEAFSINDSGQVVGSATYDSTGDSHSFLYSGGQMQDLSTLTGDNYFSASDINDSGQIVGHSNTSSGARHAFLYSGGQMKDLGTLPDGSSSSAQDINDSGQIIGMSFFPTGGFHSFLYSGGQMQDLTMLSGRNYFIARDINNTGQIVGDSEVVVDPQTSSKATRAFMYSDGQMKDLGTLGGTWSTANSVNDSGQVVGSSGTSNGLTRAFLYSGAQMHNLNTLIPTGSDWVLQEAWGINTSGQIIGNGLLNGQHRAFLATPTTSLPDTTPPKVMSTSPKANSTEVDPASNIRATFSEDMDSNTINGQTFKLFKKGTTTQIAAQVSYNTDTEMAKLDPTNNLRRGVAYKAVVSTWARDVAGNRLDQDGSASGLQQKRWFFRVDD